MLLLGSKLILVAQFGNMVPYWDQWDAEASTLYKLYVEHSLNGSTLLAPHNEHRIFVTRALSLLLFELAGGWDPILQMVVNAVLHVSAILVFTALISRLLPLEEYISYIVLVAALFSLPLGWENSLAGFQSQVYVVLLFSFLTLVLLVRARAFSLEWLAGIAFSMAAYFSLASGALTLISAGIVVALQLSAGTRQRTLPEIFSFILMIAIAFIMIANIPHLSHHDFLKAHSLGQFASALLRIAAVPFPWLVVGLLLHLPLLALLLRFFQNRRILDPARWTFVAFVAWLGLQMVSIAYNRAAAPASSRYLDIVIFIFVLDFVAIRLLSKDFPRYCNFLTATWLGLFATGMGFAAPSYFAAAAERGRQGSFQNQNVSNYLATGDIASISNKPSMHVPYPSSVRLATLLSDRSVRMILPDDILPAGERSNERHSQLVSGGKWAVPVRRFRNFTLARAPLLLAIGFALCMVVSLYRRGDMKTASNPPTFHEDNFPT
jgi:hypothetical protein